NRPGAAYSWASARIRLPRPWVGGRAAPSGARTDAAAGSPARATGTTATTHLSWLSTSTSASPRPWWSAAKRSGTGSATGWSSGGGSVRPVGARSEVAPMSTPGRRLFFAVLALVAVAGAGIVAFRAFAEDEWEAGRSRVPLGADREAVEAAVGKAADG